MNSLYEITKTVCSQFTKKFAVSVGFDTDHLAAYMPKEVWAHIDAEISYTIKNIRYFERIENKNK